MELGFHEIGLMQQVGGFGGTLTTGTRAEGGVPRSVGDSVQGGIHAEGKNEASLEMYVRRKG